MNTSIQKLLKNILANQIGFFVSVIVTFFLSPFVVHSLGGTRYGIWVLVVSLTGNYSLLAFGIQGAMTRYIAHAAATNDQERVNGYFNTALLFLLGSAVLSVIIGLVVALFIDTIFVIPMDLVKDARSACVLVTFSAAATFSFAAFDSVLIAHQRFQLTNAVGIFTTLVRAGMTVWFLKQGYGIVTLAALGAGLTLFNGLIIAVLAKRIYSWLRLSLTLARRSYFKELMDYGYKSFTVGVAVALVYQCDLLITGAYLAPDRVAIYSFASMVVTYMIQLTSNVASTFGPYATELYAKGKFDDLRNFFIIGSCIMYMLGGLLVAGCIIYGEAFFTLWISPEYKESAVILAILIFPQFFSTGAKVGGSLLVGRAKIGPLAVAAICNGVCNLVLSVLLVRYFGIMGVAVGTLVPLTVMDAIWLPLYVSRVFNIKARSIYLKSMLPGMGIVLIGLMVGYFMRENYPPVSWGPFALNTILVTCCCIVMAYLFITFVKGNKSSNQAVLDQS